MNVYVLSYLPDDEESQKFSKRSAQILKQLDWFAEQSHCRDLDVMYLAQRWSRDFSAKFSSRVKELQSKEFTTMTVRVMAVSDNMGPAAGRNMLIDQYVSLLKDSPAFFFDDDILCFTSDKKMSVFEYVERLPEQVSKIVHTMSFKNGRYRSSSEDPKISKLVGNTELAGGVFYVSSNRVFYSGVRFDTSLTTLEDTDFAIALANAGMTNVTCHNPYMIEMSAVSLLSTGEYHRKKLNHESKNIISKKWSGVFGPGIVDYDGNRMNLHGLKKFVLKKIDVEMKISDLPGFKHVVNKIEVPKTCFKI